MASLRLLPKLVAVTIAAALATGMANGTSAAGKTTPAVQKYFFNTETIVGAGGSLAGEASDIATPNMVVSCYKQYRACFSFRIITIGDVVEIEPIVPLSYDVKVWTADQITAELSLPCGTREVWVLDRVKQTAALVGEQCGTNKPFHLTLE